MQVLHTMYFAWARFRLTDALNRASKLRNTKLILKGNCLGSPLQDRPLIQKIRKKEDPTSPKPFFISSVTSTMSCLLLAYSPMIHKAWRWILSVISTQQKALDQFERALHCTQTINALVSLTWKQARVNILLSILDVKNKHKTNKEVIKQTNSWL